MTLPIYPSRFQLMNKENTERLQTQIEMIRSESRILSYRIERMIDQRKELQEEKRKLKDLLDNFQGKLTE